MKNLSFKEAHYEPVSMESAQDTKEFAQAQGKKMVNTGSVNSIKVVKCKFPNKVPEKGKSMTETICSHCGATDHNPQC